MSLLRALSLAWLGLTAAASPWGPKEAGILLLGPEGEGWKTFTAQLRKELGDVPLETATGSPGYRDLRRALERLEKARARKIVVVPVALTAQSPELDQVKYLLGLREFPSREFLEAGRASQKLIPRARPNVPLVMTGALEDHPLVAQALWENAKRLSREPAKESVVLVGAGSPADGLDQAHRALLKSLALQVQKLGSFRLAVGTTLRVDAEEKAQKKAERELRELVRNLSADGPVLVLPYLVAQDGTERIIQKRLDGLFIRFATEALLPHPRIAEWVRQRLILGRALENMVKYKDAGKVLPPPERKRIIK